MCQEGEALVSASPLTVQLLRVDTQIGVDDGRRRQESRYEDTVAPILTQRQSLVRQRMQEHMQGREQVTPREEPSRETLFQLRNIRKFNHRIISPFFYYCISLYQK